MMLSVNATVIIMEIKYYCTILINMILKLRALKVSSQGKGISSIRLDPEILKAARTAATNRQITLSEVVEQALSIYLENEKERAFWS
jgi:hypothetical protein